MPRGGGPRMPSGGPPRGGGGPRIRPSEMSRVLICQEIFNSKVLNLHFSIYTRASVYLDLCCVIARFEWNLYILLYWTVL